MYNDFYFDFSTRVKNSFLKICLRFVVCETICFYLFFAAAAATETSRKRKATKIQQLLVH